QPGARFGLPDLPAAVGFVAMVTADVGSEVADPGLAGRPTLIRTEIRNRVILIHAAAHPGGIGEYISWVAQLQLFAAPGRDLITIHGGVSGGQIDHRLRADPSAVAEHHPQPTQQDRAD